MRAPRTSLVPWLLLAMVALIGYGSLYPFNFKAGQVPGGLWQAFQELTWARADRADRVSNVLLYIPLGFCLFLWGERGMRRWLAAVLALLGGTLLSLSIEVTQAYISPRVPSFMDLTLNAIGTALGVAGGITWRALSWHLQLRRSAGAGRGDRSAWAVILLWLGWRLSPYVPHLSLHQLKGALQPLIRPHIELDATLSYLVYWLVVAQALFAINSEFRGLEALLVLIATVLVGRLLLVNQVFLPAELLALLLMIPTLIVVNRLRLELRPLLLISALTIVMTCHALAPFEFTATPGSFNGWPFVAWLRAGLPIDFAQLFARLFEWAALLWLLKEAGAGRELAVVLVTLLVLSLEVLRIWTPGGSGSIAAPVLALGLGLLLRSVDADSRGRRAALQRMSSRRARQRASRDSS